MADQASSRFTAQNQNTAQRLSTNTVGLVNLSDFRKRRAEVLEQQEREARDASSAPPPSGTSSQVPTPPDRSLTGTPDNKNNNNNNNSGKSEDGGGPLRKKLKGKKNGGKKLLSFGEDEDNGEEEEQGVWKAKKKKENEISKDEATDHSKAETKAKFKANASVAIIPKALTKAALRKEAAEREALRREFLSVQEAVKATDIALPFVFYDGANTPGGTVRVKKGDFVWVFLDKSRKVGAKLSTGDKAATRKAWARVGVDDLMLVRGSVIIPHHYDFYFFALNRSLGPGGQPIFNFSNERPPDRIESVTTSSTEPLTTAESKAAAARALPDISTLEGADDDPNLTLVVDRRWYERNKHIYPASTWQEFDPEKDYSKEVRRDTGGNAFFFSR